MHVLKLNVQGKQTDAGSGSSMPSVAYPFILFPDKSRH